MNCDLLQKAIEAFNSLWKCEKVDTNTLRIQTPYASINNKYITLYIKEQGDDLVVSDGGYLQEYFLSGDLGKPNIKFFDLIVNNYINEFEISVKDASPAKFYFKKTNQIDYLPNCIFEMADFAKNFLSALYIGSDKAVEEDLDLEEKKFYKIAKNYISDTFKQESKYQLLFNEEVGFDGQKKKISLLIQKPSSLDCVQFLSGGNVYTYKSRINNTKSDFELLTTYPLIKSKFALYDDRAEVYEESKLDLDAYLELLSHVLTEKPIPWSKKEELGNIFV